MLCFSYYPSRKRRAYTTNMCSANFSRFSSDRTIADYANEIWKIEPNKDKKA